MDFLFGENTFKTGTAQTEFHRKDWYSFVCFMSYWRRKLRPAHPWHKLSCCPWFSFIELIPGSTQRTKPCVKICTDGIGFDIDRPGWTIERLDARLDPFKRLIYTSTNSRYHHQRFRVVLETDRAKTVAEQEALWRALNVVLDGEVDPSTKDCTRLLYVPANWYGADNSWYERDGICVPVDAMVAAAPPPDSPGVRVTTSNGTTIEHHEVSVLPGNQPPPFDPIITDAMIERQLGQHPGGRMWKLLCGAACRYKLSGWVLTDQQLADAAERANRLISPGVKRHDLLREAARALAYAEAHAVDRNPTTTNVETKVPPHTLPGALARYRRKLLWHLSHDPV